jgi:hypothetical protein
MPDPPSQDQSSEGEEIKEQQPQKPLVMAERVEYDPFIAEIIFCLNRRLPKRNSYRKMLGRTFVRRDGRMVFKYNTVSQITPHVKRFLKENPDVKDASTNFEGATSDQRLGVMLDELTKPWEMLAKIVSNADVALDIAKESRDQNAIDKALRIQMKAIELATKWNPPRRFEGDPLDMVRDFSTALDVLPKEWRKEVLDRLSELLDVSASVEDDAGG